MTGCLTMWMGQRIRPVPPERRRGIYLVDVPPAAEPLIPADILHSGVRLSNEPDDVLQAAGLKARLRENALLLDKLRGAELVITRRLHVMLPCIGFGTPVVTFTAAKPPRMQKNWRFDGCERFARIVPLDAQGGARMEVDWNDRRPSEIPSGLRARFEEFCARIGSTDEPIYDCCTQAVEQLIPDNAAFYPRRSARPVADWVGRTLSGAGLRAMPR